MILIYSTLIQCPLANIDRKFLIDFIFSWLHIFEIMQFEFEMTCSNKIFSFYLNIYKSCREAMLSIYCPRNSFICCHIIDVYFQIWSTRFKYLFLGIELSIRHAFITFYKYKISRLRVLRWTKNFDLKYIKLINSLFTLRVILIYWYRQYAYLQNYLIWRWRTHYHCFRQYSSHFGRL